MRISTNTLFTLGQTRISELQSGLMKTQQQISSGRRILSPADDPIGASQVLNLDQGQAMNAQYATNRLHAGYALQGQESTLASLDNLVQDMKTLLVSAGNGALDDAQRGFIAVELDGQIDQMLALANSRDAMGNAMFAGFQTGMTPFTKTASGASYSGDAGVRMLQVDATRQLSVSVSGSALFEQVDTGTAAQPGTRQSMFATLRQLSDALKTPTTTPAAQTACSTRMGEASNALNTMLDRVLSVRAGVGAQQKEIDALDVAGSQRDYEYAQARSQLQDVDYVKALSDLSQRQITLEAAQKSFVQVSKLSLFDLI